MTHSRIPGRRLLHSPGPTPIPDEVLHAMSVQPMDLGDVRVDTNIAACEDGLRRLFRTREADIFMYAANGHGVWEAVIENLLAPGESVLVLGASGGIGIASIEIAKALGATVLACASSDDKLEACRERITIAEPSEPAELALEELDHRRLADREPAGVTPC